MIPKTITRDHILKALENIDFTVYDKRYESIKYDLLYNGLRYPPKFIISFAYKFVSGKFLPFTEFSGGAESKNFLLGHGFSLIDKLARISGTSIQPEDAEDIFTEGKEKFTNHKSYEQNSLLSKNKKETVLKEKGYLSCEACGFDFYKIYGERGYGFIECHHNKPVSEMDGESEVLLEDLSLLCSNCHKIIHRTKPWMTVAELKSISFDSNYFEIKQFFEDHKIDTIRQEAIVELFNSVKKPRKKEMNAVLQKVGCNDEETHFLADTFYHLAYALANNIPYRHARYEATSEPEGGLTAGILPFGYLNKK